MIADYSEWLKNRLTQLRLQKGVSEYQMSLDLGQSKGYIQQITSGRALPSMNKFFAICDYLQVTPVEFFDMKNTDPHLTRKITEKVKSMCQEDIELLMALADRMNRKDSGDDQNRREMYR